VRAFLRGLDLGATDPVNLDEAGRGALTMLTQASAQLGAMSELARTQAPRGEEARALTDASYAALSTVTRDCMQRIEASLRLLRAPDGRRWPGSGVGPTDLCPCGSEKPQKRCCGAPV
jgi:hypothetical protein